jgi:transposase
MARNGRKEWSGTALDKPPEECRLMTRRQIKEVLRLKHAHQLLIREIAASCGLPSSTVNDYLARAQTTGLSWPLPDGLDDQW